MAPPSSEPNSTNRPAIRLLGFVTKISWLLLFTSGFCLIFWYRPTAAAAYADMETIREAATFSEWLRRIHRVLLLPAIIAPVALAVLHFVARQRQQGFFSVGLVIATLFAGFTGFLLPWDQLALWAVTAGTNMMGFRSVFAADNVRFVLLGGVEVSVATLRFWFIVHTVAIPAFVLVGNGFNSWRTRPAR